MPDELKRILILCKTYPSPSQKHAETSCVAGICDSGELIRLFPMPFRLVSDRQKFKKWQWITARISKAKSDHRPESHKIFIDTIECENSPISTKDKWAARRIWIDKIPTFSDFAAIEVARQKNNQTLALLKPEKILGIDITKTSQAEWTDKERENLLKAQNNTSLFDSQNDREIKILKKMPFEFHYRYQCKTDNGLIEYRHKIVDWEAGALYWNIVKKHGDNWQNPFKEKLENILPQNDLMFLLGTIHRFPSQWLIISLIYPPKRLKEEQRQGSLF